MQLYILYDGDCPFCTHYVRLTRLRAQVEVVELVNLREQAQHPVVVQAIARGYAFDEGMVMKLDEAWYHAEQAMHQLALLSSPVNWFNRMMIAIFRREKLARYLYPMLRAGRSLTLRLLGRKTIGLSEGKGG